MASYCRVILYSCLIIDVKSLTTFHNLKELFMVFSIVSLSRDALHISILHLTSLCWLLVSWCLLMLIMIARKSTE
jgi:type III secretory pathway component EscU